MLPRGNGFVFPALAGGASVYRAFPGPSYMTIPHEKGVISSLHHPAIRQIRFLRCRKERKKTQLFWMEGTRFIAQALRHDAPLETLVVAPRLLVQPSGRRLARELRHRGTSCLEVSEAVFRGISLAEEPSGIGAVVRQRWEPIRDLDPHFGLCWIALDSVRAPGNLGTIIRTADAVGAAGVILIGPAIDPYDPATVRATMGALFAQKLVRASWDGFMAWRRRHRCLLVGTSPHARLDYRAVAYRAPTVLFMGGERQGLPAHYQEKCDLTVHIPMVGESDSLNLAVATSILLYELFNQRREAPTTDVTSANA